MKNEKNRNRSELSKIRRNNAKLYPIYKMFSWDLLFFYSIEFLFCTITKKVAVSEVMVIYGLYLLFRCLGQVPAVVITDIIGKRKSIILGNTLLILSILNLIFLPGAIGMIMANLIYALGYDMKVIAETNLLYDSVATRGGDGLYSKLDAKGGSLYYILDGIASLTAGYLFVINNYLPMVICILFLVISTILSFRFKEVYPIDNKTIKKDNLKETVCNYGSSLKSFFKFMFKSSRMKSLVIFMMVFYSLICIVGTYNSDLLLEIGVSEEQFSIIFAVLTFIGGISLSLKSPIEKRFKNRTLSFISLTYISSCIVIGAVCSITTEMIVIPIVLVMYVIQKITTSIWYILEYKYLKNFTTEMTRNKITFSYEVIGGCTAGIFTMLGGLLIKIVNVRHAFLIVGPVFLLLMAIVLNYMKKRLGLKPEEYKKEDIEFQEDEQ